MKTKYMIVGGENDYVYWITYLPQLHKDIQYIKDHIKTKGWYKHSSIPTYLKIYKITGRLDNVVI